MPLSNDENHVDTYHDGEPLRYRIVEDILGEQPMPGLVPHVLEVMFNKAAFHARLGGISRRAEGFRLA
jgi:hypothetical protein